MTKDDIIPKEHRVLNVAKLSALFDLSRYDIEKMAEAKIIPYYRNEDGDSFPGRFDIIDVCQMLLKKIEEKGSKTSLQSLIGRSELAKFQKLEASTEREIMHTEMMKANLVRMEDVDATVGEMIITIKTKLMGFASHVSRMILGKENYDEVCTILTEQMERTMIDLATPPADNIVARNRKMARYTEAMEGAEEGNISEKVAITRKQLAMSDKE